VARPFGRVQIVTSWDALDEKLRAINEELRGDGFMLTDSSLLQLSPPTKHSDLALRTFEAIFDLLEREFGEAFLRSGNGRRTIRDRGDPIFAAEVLLSGYLLIILLPRANQGELAVARVLARERSILAKMIESLPPIGGGRPAVAARLPTP
jgi:hypothetical protein